MAGQSKSRMLVLLPLLFLSNKIDVSDSFLLNVLRGAFLSLQLISLFLGYYIKSKIINKKDQRKIYVPAVVSPFTPPDPNGGVMNESTYYVYELNKVKEFINQTLIGAVISFFIHYKFGVNQIVVIQSLMIPLNLYDNMLIHKYILGLVKSSDRIWDEKLENEMTTGSSSTTSKKKELEMNKGKGNHYNKLEKKKRSQSAVYKADIINKAWDEGQNINLNELYETLKDIPNLQTENEGWTCLMVVCGSKHIESTSTGEEESKIKGTSDFIAAMIEKKIDVAIQDNDGWTALHWGAFHGQKQNVRTLLDLLNNDDIEKILKIKDNNGCTAKMVAENEGNKDIVEILESFENGDVNEKEIDETRKNLKQRKNVNNNEKESIHNVD